MYAVPCKGPTIGYPGGGGTIAFSEDVPEKVCLTTHVMSQNMSKGKQFLDSFWK